MNQHFVHQKITKPSPTIIGLLGIKNVSINTYNRSIGHIVLNIQCKRPYPNFLVPLNKVKTNQSSSIQNLSYLINQWLRICWKHRVPIIIKNVQIYFIILYIWNPWDTIFETYLMKSSIFNGWRTSNWPIRRIYFLPIFKK